MSSYIVDDKTINRFLSFKSDLSTTKITEFGKLLLKMNIDATEQRYPKNHYLTPEQKKERINNFKFVFEPVSLIQKLKSLRCFLYQCSEGNIPKRKLYKEMREKGNELAFKIIDELPEYDEAEWG